MLRRDQPDLVTDVWSVLWFPFISATHKCADMINIFEVFLPQLLAYPNVQDPLNAEAAHLMQREPKAYEAKVKGR
jgi:ubiquitin-protein ligase